MSIVLLGAGNLATNLALAFIQNGLLISQIYSRTETSATTLANKLNTAYTTDIHHIKTDADIYIYALKDDVLADVAEQIHAPEALHIHTSGSNSIEVLKMNKKHVGVLYPLQTFSKDKKVSFNNIPLLIEGGTKEDLRKIQALAEEISTNIYEVNSDNRAKIHLAAVFACNFTNRMYAIAQELVKDTHLPFDILLPLIDETALKVHTIDPKKAQTGPAVRYDKKIMDKHIAMLKDDNLKWIYELISENIHDAK